MRFVASRSLRNLGTAVVAVVAGLLLVPRASDASCGDYLQVHGRIIAMDHSTPDQPTSRDGAADDAADRGSHRRPCHGPGCSNGSIPPEAPVPVVIVSIDRWAMAPGHAAPEIESCCTMLAEPFGFVPDGFRLSILRPPR
jgi:hypothetical protein